MKKVIFLFCVGSFFCFISCKKEDSLKGNDGFVKSVGSVTEVNVVGSIQLESGNTVIITRNQNRMIKIDSSGEVIWDKSSSSFNQTIWDVIPVPGTGYATLGIVSSNDQFLYVCLYDTNGNFITEKQIVVEFINAYTSPSKFLRLSNGNYVIAGGSYWDWTGNIFITDQDFNLIDSKKVYAPANYAGFDIRGLSETPDGSIAMIASTTYSCLCDTNDTDIMLLRTDLDGNTKSLNLVSDFVYNEMPNGISNSQNGVISVSSRMVGLDGNAGTFTNYYGYQTIAGGINLSVFNAGGQFISSKEITNYPGNGVISTIKQTADGGYILCGTVNTLNSSIVVSQTKIFVCKLNSNLDVQWSNVVNTSYQAIGVDIQQTSDGGYRIIGHHRSMDSQFKILILKVDSSGNY